MTFFISTAMGFITNNIVDQEHPKRCIDQTRSRDVRWAHPFNTWDEANRFATALTMSLNWPPSARYYAILTSASPNVKPDPQPETESLPIVEEPKATRLGDRLRALIGAV
jgi:hypothetical protein